MEKVSFKLFFKQFFCDHYYNLVSRERTGRVKKCSFTKFILPIFQLKKRCIFCEKEKYSFEEGLWNELTTEEYCKTIGGEVLKEYLKEKELNLEKEKSRLI